MKCKRTWQIKESFFKLFPPWVGIEPLTFQSHKGNNALVTRVTSTCHTVDLYIWCKSSLLSSCGFHSRAIISGRVIATTNFDTPFDSPSNGLSNEPIGDRLRFFVRPWSSIFENYFSGNCLSPDIVLRIAIAIGDMRSIAAAVAWKMFEKPYGLFCITKIPMLANRKALFKPSVSRDIKYIRVSYSS